MLKRINVPYLPEIISHDKIVHSNQTIALKVGSSWQSFWVKDHQLIPRALKFQGNSSQTLQIYNC